MLATTMLSVGGGGEGVDEGEGADGSGSSVAAMTCVTFLVVVGLRVVAARFGATQSYFHRWAVGTSGIAGIVVLR